MKFKLPVLTPKGTLFFKAEEIIRLEACSNYTTIYLTHQRKYLTSKVLKNYSPFLETLGFIRANRSHLLNPEHIQVVQKDGLILMMDEKMIQVAMRKRGVLLRNMNLL